MTYDLKRTHTRVCVCDDSIKLWDKCVVPFTEGALIFVVLLIYCVFSGCNILLLIAHMMHNRSLNVIF